MKRVILWLKNFIRLITSFQPKVQPFATIQEKTISFNLKSKVIRLSPNFTLLEFIKSQTALRNGIDNTPKPEHIKAARLLFKYVVQKVRDRFGVTVLGSGYRSPKLNKAIGGSKASQHCKGEATDLEVPNVSNVAVAQWIRDNLKFDQLILEFYTPGDPSSGWVHVSYKASGNRQEVLTAKRVNNKTVYVEGLAA